MGKKLEGLEVREETVCGLTVSTTLIKTSTAAKTIGRNIGEYITIETGPLRVGYTDLKAVGECVAQKMSSVLEPYWGGRLCICGQGNPELPADALGPETLKALPLHSFTAMPMQEKRFESVCAVVPGLSWTSGLRTEQVAKGVAQQAGATCLLIIDSLLVRRPELLFRSIQISTAGGTIPARSGEQSVWHTLGVPTLAIGVPMAAVVKGLLGGEPVTSVQARDYLAAASFAIAYGILRACWPGLSAEECAIMARLGRDPLAGEDFSGTVP